MEVLTVSTKTRRGILLEIVFTTLMILNVNHADEGGGVLLQILGNECYFGGTASSCHTAGGTDSHIILV